MKWLHINDQAMDWSIQQKTDQQISTSRRNLLAAGSSAMAAGLGGCIGGESDSDGDGVSDRNDDFPNNSEKSDLIKEYESNTLFLTDFRYRESIISSDIKLEFEIESLNGKPINVFLLSDEAYSKRVTGEQFEPIRSYTNTDKVTDVLSNSSDFDGNLNIILTRAGDEPEWIRVYYHRQVYR